MADFLPAVTKTLAAEGGFFHNLKTGEVVNMGITLATLRSLGILKSVGAPTPADISFVQTLTQQEAEDIYRIEYWEKLKLDQINSQEVANKMFDLGVNMGVDSAARILQRAAHVPIDGIVGPQTITAANALPAQMALAYVRSGAAARYQEIAAANTALAPNLPGWLSRLNS